MCVLSCWTVTYASFSLMGGEVRIKTKQILIKVHSIAIKWKRVGGSNDYIVSTYPVELVGTRIIELHSSTCLRQQRVSSLERCPILRGTFIERFHCNCFWNSSLTASETSLDTDYVSICIRCLRLSVIAQQTSSRLLLGVTCCVLLISVSKTVAHTPHPPQYKIIWNHGMHGQSYYPAAADNWWVWHSHLLYPLPLIVSRALFLLQISGKKATWGICTLCPV